MSISRIVLGLVAAAGVGIAAAPSFADVITTATGNGADTYLTNDSNSGPTATHGTEEGLEVRQYNDVRTRIAYLRFDLSSVTGTITGATLSMDFTYSNRGRTLTVYGLNDGNAGENWDETTTSYSNAPGFVAASAGNFAIDSSALTQLGTFATSPNAVSYSTPMIQSSNTTDLPLDSFLNSDTNGVVTLAVVFTTGDNSNEFRMASKENTAGLAAPTLTFTTTGTSVPEPASLGVMGIGALALMRRRRAAR